MYNPPRPSSNQKQQRPTDYAQLSQPPAQRQVIPNSTQLRGGNERLHQTSGLVYQQNTVSRTPSSQQYQIVTQQQQQQKPQDELSRFTQSSNVKQQETLSYKMTQSEPIKSTKTKGICGLRNIGNTCFMQRNQLIRNSLLQCVINLPGFNESLIAEELSSRQKINQVAHEYSKLVQALRQMNNYQAEAPYGVKSAVENVAPSFRGYAQQDAQEFMVAFLDAMSLGLNRVTGKPKYKEMNDDLRGRDLQALSQEWWDYSKSREDSVVLDYFQGQLLNTLKCQTCGNNSYAFDNFRDISLAIPKVLTILDDFDLDRLIQKYLSEEPIDESYCGKWYENKCIRSKRLNKAKRQTQMWRLPKVLVFHIKRFNFRRFGSDKLNHKLRFQEILNMQSCISQSRDQSTKNTIYQLSGVVNHSGNLYGGHYTADARNPFDDKWYRFNDSDVREINFRDQRYDTDGSSNPYILFYSQRF